MEPFWDLGQAGAVVVKTITKKPRRGNPMPRLCETPSGLLNSIGLPNKGIDAFIEITLPKLRGKAACLIVNIAGTCTGEFGELAARLDGAEGVDALELNISCPNVEGGDLPFGRDPQVVHRLVRDVRSATRLPITKLSPNVPRHRGDRAADEGGSDMVSPINTLGTSVDWRTGAGLHRRWGPAGAMPIALRMCWEAAGTWTSRSWHGAPAMRTCWFPAWAAARCRSARALPHADAVPRAVAGLRERLAAAGRRDVRSIIRSVRAG
jgi:dihydroorotate dehydrogenase (NAD+) catalytic subunit